MRRGLQAQRAVAAAMVKHWSNYVDRASTRTLEGISDLSLVHRAMIYASHAARTVRAAAHAMTSSVVALVDDAVRHNPVLPQGCNELRVRQAARHLVAQALFEKKLPRDEGGGSLLRMLDGGPVAA